MHTTSIEHLRDRLATVKGQWRDIAEASGVPYSTFTKIAQGKTKNPGFDTVTNIDRALQEYGHRIANGETTPAEHG